MSRLFGVPGFLYFPPESSPILSKRVGAGERATKEEKMKKCIFSLKFEHYTYSHNSTAFIAFSINMLYSFVALIFSACIIFGTMLSDVMPGMVFTSRK